MVVLKVLKLIRELKKQMKVTKHLVVIIFLQYNLQMISTMFVGHIGDLFLSITSMATSFTGLTDFNSML